MEYIRQWKVGDSVFASKREAQKAEAAHELTEMFDLGPGDADPFFAHADAIIALLKPFATPKTRKPKASNGTVKNAPGAKAAKPAADQPSA